jgi:hypothetical protein
MEACRVLDIPLAGKQLRSALDAPELMRDWDVALMADLLVSDGRRAWAASGNVAATDPPVRIYSSGFSL